MLIFYLTSCASFINKPLPDGSPKNSSKKATFNIQEKRGKSENTLVILSLSGGGSRAAYWSASIMLKLEDIFKDEGINILKEVDLISAVSGGSLPAAYYAISSDPNDPPNRATSGRIWEAETVKELMTKNYLLRWFGNWFWPSNIVQYWLTPYGRSDIMAKIFADNLYDTDTKFFGRDLTFKDINPNRPYLILNSTNGTKNESGQLFTFTNENFDRINSDLKSYKISYAVMASSAFPGVFNYIALRNFSKGEDKYLQIFDGGNYDNLGLKSVRMVLEKLSCQEKLSFQKTGFDNSEKLPCQKKLSLQHTSFDKLIVILVDAFVENEGVNPNVRDVRNIIGLLLDLNIIDSFNSIFSANREARIDIFKDIVMKNYDPKKSIFYHIQFSDIKDDELKGNLNAIKSNFAISPENIDYIDEAVESLIPVITKGDGSITTKNDCLLAIKKLLLDEKGKEHSQYCRYQNSQ